MTVKFEIPCRMPVMTLPETVFFPQALLPLQIFEDRYRKMLRDVLSNDRMFAITSLDDTFSADQDRFEPPRRIATAGIIRACLKRGDGTSNLVVQGLCRVYVSKILSEAPYRLAEIIPLRSSTDFNAADMLRLKGRLLGCIGAKRRLGSNVPKEVLSFLKTIEEPEIVADLAAFSLCDDHEFKQTLLETLDPGKRLEIFIKRLTGEIDELRLQRKLQGSLDDEDIWRN